MRRSPRWLDLEAYAISQRRNNQYFRLYRDPETGKERQDLNFAGYYKGANLDNDLRNFFFSKTLGC